jgi:hypothetical protein
MTIHFMRMHWTLVFASTHSLRRPSAGGGNIGAPSLNQ